MQALKLVITGAYAAGKSSFIRTISDIEVVATEYATSDPHERAVKPETTVALDFGMTAISDVQTLYLFGTPGQERFDFMWEQLSVGCLGYVVLVDSCRPADLEPARRLLERFAALTDVPFVVAANKQDDPAALPLPYLRQRLGLAPEVALVPCVATDKASVRQVLLTLLARIERTAPTE
jgi:uncharacterized protein